MPIVHTYNKGEWTLYVQDQWANGPWANGILGECVRGRKIFGRTDCHLMSAYISYLCIFYKKREGQGGVINIRLHLGPKIMKLFSLKSKFVHR